jgi:hypothetical protein
MEKKAPRSKAIAVIQKKIIFKRFSMFFKDRFPFFPAHDPEGNPSMKT